MNSSALSLLGLSLLDYPKATALLRNNILSSRRTKDHVLLDPIHLIRVPSCKDPAVFVYNDVTYSNARYLRKSVRSRVRSLYFVVVDIATTRRFIDRKIQADESPSREVLERSPDNDVELLRRVIGSFR